MKGLAHPTLIFALLLAVTAPQSVVADDIDRDQLGKSVKLTILVDKVMQPEAGWKTEEWMVKEAAEAGFNIFSPRVGHERLDEVRLVADWCKKYGIFYMPWMRGTLTAPPTAEANGKRVVWAGGNEQPLWSPNSDEFWEWTNRYIVEYAKLAAEKPSCIGVFLDYENYAPGSQGNLYSLSYDDIILKAFATESGITLPELALKERRGWLENQDRHDAFEEFQVKHWRQRCRALRQAVDKHDPTFQFCIYPAPGTPFMVQATYPEWATERAPLILADASTYGRPSRFLPEQDSLEVNRQKMMDGVAFAKEAGIPFMYSGGIDPVVSGADPEFSGKNAVMISEVTDGYWIFYEGPTYTKQDHADYWKWFSWANKAIAEGRFDVQREARQTPEDWSIDVFGRTTDGPKLVIPEGVGETMEFPEVTLRRDNLIILAAKAGQPVEITLQDIPVARYTSLLAWDVRNLKMEKLASGTIAHNESGVVQFTPEEDGIYFLGASAGTCAYAIVKSNVPVGLHAGDGLSLIYGVKRLYFHVPDGTAQFKLSLKGQGAETVRLNVMDPSGKQVATAQTTMKERSAEVKVAPGDAAGGIWSLELTRADEGTLEDCSIKLDDNLPPTLSLTPECVFKTIAPEK